MRHVARASLVLVPDIRHRAIWLLAMNSTNLSYERDYLRLMDCQRFATWNFVRCVLGVRSRDLFLVVAMPGTDMIIEGDGDLNTICCYSLGFVKYVF